MNGKQLKTAYFSGRYKENLYHKTPMTNQLLYFLNVSEQKSKAGERKENQEGQKRINHLSW